MLNRKLHIIGSALTILSSLALAFTPGASGAYLGFILSFSLLSLGFTLHAKASGFRVGIIITSILPTLLITITFFRMIRYLGTIFNFSLILGIGLVIQLLGALVMVIGAFILKGTKAQNPIAKSSHENKTFLQLCFQPIKKYADFSGRAQRMEYWGFSLLFIILLAPLFILAVANQYGRPDDATSVVILILGIIYLALFIPTLAVTVRRLHDTGRNGWFILISIIPFGSLLILAFALIDSEPGANAYGSNPKTGDGENIHTQNRRLKEQLQQERLKTEAFQKDASARLDAHDQELDIDTKEIQSNSEAPVQIGENQKEWFYELDGVRKGPTTQDIIVGKINSGELLKNALVWNDAMTDWKQAADVSELQTDLEA